MPSVFLEVTFSYHSVEWEKCYFGSDKKNDDDDDDEEKGHSLKGDW